METLSDPAISRDLNRGKLYMLFLKCINRERYYKIKSLQRSRGQVAELVEYGQRMRIPPRIEDRLVSFKHSGHAGDIIYSLPALKALAGSHGANLLLALKIPLPKLRRNHPLGGVMLDDGTYRMLEPLLVAQEYIRSVAVYGGQDVDFDLDCFRASPLPLEKVGISRWYFYMFGVVSDLSQPWLRASPDPDFSHTIVIARSFRYRNLSLDYRFLSEYKNIVFLGLEDEYNDIKKQVANIEWVRVRDFLHMAQIVAGCRLFIGNQSFPYSLAEALKTPRVLEVDPFTPNVVPAGALAFDALFQRQFEYVVDYTHRATSRGKPDHGRSNGPPPAQAKLAADARPANG
jgi:hypothetical protein